MKRITISTAVATLLLAGVAAAQDAPPVISGAYMRCNQAQAARANEIVRTVWGPIAQKHVASGQITSWGSIAHRQGGAWRRASVLRGNDLDALMDAGAAINDEMRSQHPAAANELNTICPSHDDYIWIGVANSPPNPDPAAGPASLSAYYVCDVAREGRADQIFEQLMAPIYKKHTDMGHLAGWGFYSHRFGGEFRRLETFSGPDHKTLLRLQNEIYQEAQESDALAFNEFRQICNSHVDYMWMNAATQ